MQKSELVSVWKLEEETVGLLLQKILAENDIPSKLKSEQIPWMNGIMKAARGYWGDLLVLESDAEKAKEIIETYLDQKSPDVE